MFPIYYLIAKEREDDKYMHRPKFSHVHPKAPKSKAQSDLQYSDEPMHGFVKGDNQVTNWWTQGQDELNKALHVQKELNENVAKNVIIFIGELLIFYTIMHIIVLLLIFKYEFCLCWGTNIGKIISNHIR